MNKAVYIKHDYDTDAFSFINKEQFEQMLNEFDREIQVMNTDQTIQSVMHTYADVDVSEEIDVAICTTYFHFDSECDVYMSK